MAVIDRDQVMLTRLIERGTIEPTSRRIVEVHDLDGGDVEELEYEYNPRPYDPLYGSVTETRYRCTTCGEWVIEDPDWSPTEKAV